ncbi:PP2C family protein-serine/threonine phosphatase [[Mycoplasma] mobile]|uniref:Phosphoprotein ser/thr phosphatase n=1 Tax=Mycoplasma mobile (strain ATCC 43663 / 163K / NCTC 11711) TaxID=267748 RepID=Q6KH86_MYCM1|nr:protein phosphatase 2C domain-containing protein [[Mycoplasma] mobile]AAT28044.1 phosphoprotein ser/thr phosphatase [Mycoplasma mobile 163K]
MKFKYTVLTNIGVVRKENQDRAKILENEEVVFAILCDGMGGHFGGSIAAEISIKTFENFFNARFPKNVKNETNVYFEWVKEALKNLKDAMLKEANGDAKKMDMGTTMTAAIIFKNTHNIIIFNIGDSRAYIYNGFLHQITVDQNLTNYYIKEKKWNEFEASKIPGGSALVSSIGPNKKTNVEIFQVDRSEANIPKYVVLTSDGVHDYVTKDYFEKIVGSNNLSLEQKSDLLIKEAIKGHSTDNLTIAIVEVPNGY